MIAYALGWHLIPYLVIRVPAALLRSDRLAIWASYTASATTIATLLGF
ncbi:hypothetical protein [Streptomyces microflavus]